MSSRPWSARIKKKLAQAKPQTMERPRDACGSRLLANPSSNSRSQSLDPLCKVSTLLRRDFQLHLRRLAAAICASVGAGPIRGATVELAHVELTLRTSSVAQGHVDHAVVDQLRDRREVRGLLAAVGCAGADEGGRGLACQGTLLPVAPGRVPEGLHLRGHHAKASRQPKHEAVVLHKLLHSGPVHDWVARLRRRTHLPQDVIGQRLRRLEHVHISTRRPGALGELVGELFDVAVHGVVHDADPDLARRRWGQRSGDGAGEQLSLAPGEPQLQL
mmetsp:Transcript_48706/g.139266  ORF Transcript_48706/g.139266 Transcript_48706/m.139266 type:complete len:274 (+) Transcript_48706:216-1037(+)